MGFSGYFLKYAYQTLLEYFGSMSKKIFFFGDICSAVREMGSIIFELQNRVTHYDVANGVTNSKFFFCFSFSS